MLLECQRYSHGQNGDPWIEQVALHGGSQPQTISWASNQRQFFWGTFLSIKTHWSWTVWLFTTISVFQEDLCFASCCQTDPQPLWHIESHSGCWGGKSTAPLCSMALHKPLSRPMSLLIQTGDEIIWKNRVKKCSWFTFSKYLMTWWVQWVWITSWLASLFYYTLWKGGDEQHRTVCDRLHTQKKY